LKLPTTWPHRFCADKGQFWTYQKGKGRNTYGSVLFAFDLYKKDVNKPDLVLHRRFQKEWWQIWNWLEYLFAPYWACPYAATDEES
jgi:hypothetical protein